MIVRSLVGRKKEKENGNATLREKQCRRRREGKEGEKGEGGSSESVPQKHLLTLSLRPGRRAQRECPMNEREKKEKKRRLSFGIYLQILSTHEEIKEDHDQAGRQKQKKTPMSGLFCAD